MHWSNDEVEPAGVPNGPPAAEPDSRNPESAMPPMAPVERSALESVAELFEKLYAQAPELVTALVPKPASTRTLRTERDPCAAALLCRLETEQTAWQAA